MNKFTLKTVNAKYLLQELSNIGFDENYREQFINKSSSFNIKIFDLTVAQANILKQTALVFGADCAVHKEVITGKIEKSDVILCGNFSQILKISEKLKQQPFKLAILSKQLIELINQKKNKTQLVGILNITPNSFSDGGLYYNPKNAINHLIQLINDGADIVDIGAESTKPYSEEVSAEIQIERLKPVLEFIKTENIKLPISIDTRSSKVAEYCLDMGAKIINDVSGLEYDDKMIDIIAKYNAEIVIQHSIGKPENFHKFNNLVDEIFFSLKNKIEYAEARGVNNIIIDVGIGFGKSNEDCLILLDRIEEFINLNKPIMAGHSRKRFLKADIEDNSYKDALTLAYSYSLIQKGIDYLRIHNVQLHKNLLKNIPN